jgi:hypothetical protein
MIEFTRYELSIIERALINYNFNNNNISEEDISLISSARDKIILLQSK